MHSPPYNSQGDYNDDRIRQIRRRARKMLGFPASHEVGAISVMVSELLHATENRLGRKPDSVVAALPHLIALSEEDIADVSEYTGLRLQYLPYWHNHVQETGAAYAGYGLGLCANYTDQPACNDEMRAMPMETVMAVLYTEQALTVTLSVMKSALYMWEPDHRHREYFDLRHDILEDSFREQYYWDAVRQALLEIMAIHESYPRPDKVLLMGECADDKTFHAVLVNALGSLMKDLPEILAVDTLYAASKGAAELAKRGPFYPWSSYDHDGSWEHADTEALCHSRDGYSEASTELRRRWYG